MSLIISLITGALGGNNAGAVLKNFSLGTLGNSLSGIVGGGLGGALLGGGAAASGGLDIGSIIGSIASGGVGGGVVMLAVGFIKNMMAK